MSPSDSGKQVTIVVDRRVAYVFLLVLAVLVALVAGLLIGRGIGGSRRSAGQVASEAPGAVQIPIAPAAPQSDSVTTEVLPPGAARVGDQAPDFILKDLEGRDVRLSDLRGHPVLINFWATWCPPCRFEMPALEAVYREYKDEGLVILGVNTGERVRGADLQNRVRQFVQQFGLTFPIVLDADDSVATLYRLRAYPTTYFISSDGTIVDMRRGAFASPQDIKRYLAKILPAANE